MITKTQQIENAKLCAKAHADKIVFMSRCLTLATRDYVELVRKDGDAFDGLQVSTAAFWLVAIGYTPRPVNGPATLQAAIDEIEDERRAIAK